MKSKFVAVPFFGDLASQQLQYVDILTYITIRSRQEQYGTIFPSKQRIAQLMGASEHLTGQSINRLIKAGFLSIINSGEDKIYDFGELPTIVRLPEEIFTVDLPVNERATLLLLKMFCFDDQYDIGPSLKFISVISGMNIRELGENMLQLYKKKFIRQVKSNNPDHPYYLKLSKAINWIDDSGHNSEMIEFFKEELKAA